MQTDVLRNCEFFQENKDQDGLQRSKDFLSFIKLLLG